MSLILHSYKGDSPGFCYMIHKIVGYYLLAKKYSLDFYFHDDGFMYRHTEGWHDYFDSLSIYDPSKQYNNRLDFDINNNSQISMFNIFLKDNFFTLNENKEALTRITKLNTRMKALLEESLKNLNLEVGQFDSIFIRRGCKMFSESTYYDSEVYIDKLIEKGSSTVYVQTDDYSAFEELEEIIKNKYQNRIRICTLCPKTKRGTVTNITYKNIVLSDPTRITDRVTEKNINYIQSFKKNLIKSVEEFTSEEMKVHTEEMIIGLELCCLSRYLVMDIQSNVSRYLYMKHNNINNVISVDDLFRPALDTLINNGCMEFDLRRY
jgi:hypothetical protein